MNAFFTSAEVRWFKEGEIPFPVLEWFTAGTHHKVFPARTDKYLLFSHAAQAGVKIREGNFEIKTRVEELGVLEIKQLIKGKKELWEKWTQSDLDVKGPGENPRWLGIQKRRILRKLELQEDGLEEVPADQVISRGCQMELTSLKVEKQSHWTLSFESMGDYQELEKMLDQSIEFFLTPALKYNSRISTILTKCLLGKSSFGYPEWIKQLTVNI